MCVGVTHPEGWSDNYYEESEIDMCALLKAEREREEGVEREWRKRKEREGKDRRRGKG